MSNYLDDFLCEQQSDEYEYEHFQTLYDCGFFESEDEFQAWLEYEENKELDI